MEPSVVRGALGAGLAGIVAFASTLTVFAGPTSRTPAARPPIAPVASIPSETDEEEPVPVTSPRRSGEPGGRLEVVTGTRVFHGYSFDGHVHTRYSRDARHGVREVLELARRAGLDAVMITDHGSTAARDDVSGYDGPVSVTVGAEFGGTFGHALTWNFVDANAVHAANPDDMPTLGRIAHERGAVVVLAHPGWWIRGVETDPRYLLEYDTIRRGGEGESIDAVEIWNGTYPGPTSSLVASWRSLLERNVFVPIVGGSDFHQLRGNAIGEPRNVVLCEVDASGTPVIPIARCILEAAKEGRLFVTDGPTLALTVGDRVSGEILRAAPGSRVHLHARARSDEGGELVVYLGHEPVERVALEPGVPREHELVIEVPGEDSFVYAEIVRHVRRAGETERSLLTNPIRLDVGAEVADWRGPRVTDVPTRAPLVFRRRGRTTNGSVGRDRPPPASTN